MLERTLAIFFIATSLTCAATRPPQQPKSGPGGSAYTHADVRESEHGEKSTQYWLFEPQQPQPKKAPLVIFLHGYSAMSPEPYRAWIEHLVRRGNIVVYPRYQENLVTPPAEYHDNVVQSLRDALEVLAQKGHVAPDLKRLAIVGHSAGGVGAANFTARAVEEKLPQPAAVMVVHPGQGPKDGIQIVPLDDTSTIATTTHLLVVVGDTDAFVGETSARRIWARTGKVKDRTFVTVQSDDHGFPTLRANHLAPLAEGHMSTNALDWFGYWRLFDEQCAAAFSGKNYTPASGMGAWSDGTPVKPLKIER